MMTMMMMMMMTTTTMTTTMVMMMVMMMMITITSYQQCFYSFFMFRVSIKESSVAKLGSVCRRVYRIFSHAYFHHRSIYDEFEVSNYKFDKYLLLKKIVQNLLLKK